MPSKPSVKDSVISSNFFPINPVKKSIAQQFINAAINSGCCKEYPLPNVITLGVENYFLQQFNRVYFQKFFNRNAVCAYKNCFCIRVSACKFVDSLACS